jgi:type 2 lantibiotic biosynthesis protein LanM
MKPLILVAPLVEMARARLRAHAESLAERGVLLAFDPKTVDTLFDGQLEHRLLLMLNRTFALELHLARLRGRLDGDTAEDRFRSFAESLDSSDNAWRLLRDYPVLARQLVLCVDQWVEATAELLKRLVADFEEIRTTLSDHDLGLLQTVDAAGDRHGMGRCVAILTFDAGTRIVYKPRALAVERHWSEVLDWIGDYGFRPRFRTLRLLERDGYGWVEYAATQPCGSNDEIRRFYERQGGLLALLYLLNATDFHQENVIAAGEHPVLVDLEGVLHPADRMHKSASAYGVAATSVADSVLRTGLLPMAWGEPGKAHPDFSGIGGRDSQLLPFDVPQWEGLGSDMMQLVRKPMRAMGAANRPTLNGEQVDLLSHTDAIVQGFCRLYDVLLKHRHALLGPGSPVGAFEADEVRVILRPTLTYGLLLDAGYHPDVLRDSLERDWLFNRLWGAWATQLLPPKVIAAEQEALWNGDVPRFTTNPGSRDLWTWSGESIRGFLSEPSQLSVRRRIDQLAVEDREKQAWFIRASIVTDSAGLGIRRARRTSAHDEPSGDAQSTLGFATAVGDRLETLAVRGDEGAGWIGLALDGLDRWSIVPLGPDLYGGIAGVALFLAYLGDVSGNTRYTDLAGDALLTLQYQLGNGPAMESIGAFDGLSGVIYVLSHLSVLWNRTDLADQAEGLTLALGRLVECDTRFDIVGGLAGAIAGLVSLHAIRPSADAIEVACRCGDRLIREATSMERGVGWANGMGTQPLAGFSHGAAGISWALSTLGTLTGETRYIDCALAGVEYERSLYDPLGQGWPDLRRRNVTDTQAIAQTNPQPSVTAWCHGAAGIALARLGMLGILDDAATQGEIESAIAAVMALGFGDNHSLCHGDMGNLEILSRAQERLPTPELAAHIGRITDQALRNIQSEGWVCGIPLDVESPGLMTGLAGIGYGLLRLAAPSRIPSVLMLAPPTAIVLATVAVRPDSVSRSPQNRS